MKRTGAAVRLQPRQLQAGPAVRTGVAAVRSAPRSMRARSVSALPHAAASSSGVRPLWGTGTAGGGVNGKWVLVREVQCDAFCSQAERTEHLPGLCRDAPRPSPPAMRLLKREP